MPRWVRFPRREYNYALKAILLFLCPRLWTRNDAREIRIFLI